MTKSRLLTTAENYVGYTARPDRSNIFGERTGTDGGTWSGAFIDVVAAESGVPLPSCIYTPACLAEMLRTGRQRLVPKPGDLVFYVFPTETVNGYSMPHVGIVANVSQLSTEGWFEAIEGQTGSGLPKGSSIKNGVYKRRRYATDVLCYVRPALEITASQKIRKLLTKTVMPNGEKLILITPSHVRPGMKGKRIELVQLALSQVTGASNFQRGIFDAQTLSAFSRYQLSTGTIASEASGIPDDRTLRRLAMQTGLFRSE